MSVMSDLTVSVDFSSHTSTVGARVCLCVCLYIIAWFHLLAIIYNKNDRLYVESCKAITDASVCLELVYGCLRLLLFSA